MTPTLRRATAVATGAAVVIGLAACAPQPSTPKVTTLTTNLLNYQVVSNWNPVTTNYLNLFFAPPQAVYEPIVLLNPATWDYEPVLATEFEIAEDLRSIDITLREDVDFTDGTHFDAEAVRANFELVESPIFAPFFERFGPSVEVTGEYELTITTTARVDNDFMYNFSLIPIVSPTAIAEDPEALESMPVGTGPYVLEEQIPEVSVTFVRNPDYRDPDAYAFDRLEFVVFADNSIAVSNALKSGQINVANLDPSLAGEAENSGFVIRPGGGRIISLPWRDPEGAIVPQLADPRVRQAIAYALDREAINESINHGFGRATSQSWSARSPYYIEGEDDRYAYDLEKARRLMAEAGYADGFAMKMPTTVNFVPYEAVLIQSFADVGITLTFDRYPDLVAMSGATVDYAMYPSTAGDVFAAGRVRDLPQLADLFAIVDTGTAEEVAEAQQAIGEAMLDDALVISLALPLDTWVTIPEITLDPGTLTGWPPRLRSYAYAD